MNKTQVNEGAVLALDPAEKGQAISQNAARLAVASGAAVLVLLAALHFLSPEFDPSWRMVSEYAVGSYGWVLSLMFLAWAAGYVSLFFAIRSQVKTLGGKIGLFFLLTAALGEGMAAFFDFTHSLHGLAFLIGIPSIPIAALLVSISLGRNPIWAEARRSLLWRANLTWISLALMVALMFIGLSQTGGNLGPGVWIGWPNRLVFVASCTWLMFTAGQALRLRDR